MNYARKVIITGLNPSNEAVYLGLMHDGASLHQDRTRFGSWGSPRHCIAISTKPIVVCVAPIDTKTRRVMIIGSSRNTHEVRHHEWQQQSPLQE